MEHRGNQELLHRHRNGITVLHVCLSALPFSHALLLFGGGRVPWVPQGVCTFWGSKSDTAFNGACARAVFAIVGRVRCSQRVGAGTFVREGMNTLRPTDLAARNEAPVGTVLGGLGGVSNTIAI